MQAKNYANGTFEKRTPGLLFPQTPPGLRFGVRNNRQTCTEKLRHAATTRRVALTDFLVTGLVRVRFEGICFQNRLAKAVL